MKSKRVTYSGKKLLAGRYLAKKLLIDCRSSSNRQKQPPEIFCEKSVFKKFTKLTGKHLCYSLFFNKVAGPKKFFKNFQQGLTK